MTDPTADEAARLRAAARAKRSLTVVLVCLGIAVAAPLAGVAITALYVRSAFGTTAEVDPSQKARVLAQGISEAMNGAASGLVVSGVAFAVAVVFVVRFAGARRAMKPPETGGEP